MNMCWHSAGVCASVRVLNESYLSEVQGDVHLVVLGAAGQGRALPPSLRPVDGVGDGMGAVAVALGADVAVLALRSRDTDVLSLYRASMLDIRSNLRGRTKAENESVGRVWPAGSAEVTSTGEEEPISEASAVVFRLCQYI